MKFPGVHGDRFPKKSMLWHSSRSVLSRIFELFWVLAKLLSLSSIGVPRLTGEMILLTDASDIGGGAAIFQWHSLDQAQIPPEFRTTGMSKDGLLVHNYPENFRLVPLGHWNWKWNPTRQRYFTYEQELLAVVLTISTQS